MLKYRIFAAMLNAKEQGHEVKTCIVVRHLQRLNAYYDSKMNNSHNGMNGSAENHTDDVRTHVAVFAYEFGYPYDFIG